MKSLDDLKLSIKVLIPLLLMALLIACLVGLSAAKLSQVRRQSGQIVEHVDPALLLQAQANRFVQRLGYDVYRTLSYQTGTAEEDAAAKDFDDTAKAGGALFQAAAVSYPEEAGVFNAFKARYDALVAKLQAQQAVAVTTNGFGLGTKDTPDDIDVSAGVARKQVDIDRQIDAFAKDLDAFSETVSAQNTQASRVLRASSARATWTIIILGLAAVVGGTVAAVWMTSAKITRPVMRLTDRMKRLAAGELDVRVDGQARRDELGSMARAVQVFKDNGIKAKALEAEARRMNAEAEAERRRAEAERLRIEAEQTHVVNALAASLKQLAQGDLTTQIDVVFEGRYAQIRLDFNAAMSQLQETLSAVAGNTDAIRSGTGEISSAAGDLSRRTEQQAASLEETAAALDEITATVKKTSAGAVHARTVVSAAKADAERSGEVVRQTVKAMTAIETSSRQIGQIIGVIDEIAFQTNLLALNAGVEAARAGDSGRGFAVVASEVRGLAQRSAEAAKEIKALILASTSHVGEGVSLVGETGEALGRIMAQVIEINGVVSEIASSAQEQAAGLDQVNVAVNQMDQVTQQNAAMVEETTAASRNLAQDAESLAQLVQRFQIGRTGMPGRRSIRQAA